MIETTSSPGDVLLAKDSAFNQPTIAANWSHTVGLKEDGTVLGVGSNGSGRLNISGWADIKAIAAGSYHTVGLKGDGTVVAVGDNSFGQLNVSGWTDIKAIAAGEQHTVGLKGDGTVVAVGSNEQGALNVANWTDIKAIAAYLHLTVGLKEDGTVVAVGANWYGQLNVSDWTDIKAIAAGESRTVGLKEDGTVVGVGYNQHGALNVSGWTSIKAIDAGGSHTVGLKEDGTVVAVGNNGYGQLNVSDWTNIRQPSDGYVYGSLTSSSLDTQMATSVFGSITWNATIPTEAGTGVVKFQIATNNDNDAWNFVGPDGTPDTYYTTPGEAIWAGHDGARYIKYKLFLRTGDPAYTPVFHDVTLTYHLGYDYSGVLQPINPDGSSIFKIKSDNIVPVKFQLRDGLGNFVTNAVNGIAWTKTSNEILGTDNEQDVTGSPSSGTQFFYDAVTNEYFFNLDTTQLSTGTWQVTITLDDGTTRQTTFSVK